VGDDAAVLQWPGDASGVVTTDLLADGTHFELAKHLPERVGRKALAVNLSDLAAMAARPRAVVVSLLLPRGEAAVLARRVLEGMLPLAREHEVAIAGGDTNVWDGRLVISVTALGQLTEKGPLLRSGARPGDALLLTGALGGSRLGHHLDFDPRIREALLLHQRYTLHAGMDISDGLCLDASRLAAASGCGIELELNCVRIAPAAHELARQMKDGRSALEHALTDGEDFELLMAAPRDEAQRILDDQPLNVPISEVGRVIDSPGLWGLYEDGRREPLEPRGFAH
jgi:thiamine-monophosphate kinase